MRSHARPRARYGVFAPIFTPQGVAAFGRDLESARQVWSKQEGYPGDLSYRDFYRDIGYDLDYDYVKSAMPADGLRGFTGIKYHAITGSGEKRVYGVQHAKNSSIRSDAERQRGNDDRGELFRTRNRAQRVSDIADQAVHGQTLTGAAAKGLALKCEDVRVH